MVHLSDLSWDERGEDAIQNYRKGDMVKAVVTEVDTEKERISLSIKALDGDKFADAIGGVKRGSIITVEVTAIEDGGIEVEYEGMKSFIRRSDLSRDRAEQRPERFQVGDKVDVRVTNVDSQDRAVWACRSRRARSPKRRKPWNSTARPTRAPRWATSSARRSRATRARGRPPAACQCDGFRKGTRGRVDISGKWRAHALQALHEGAPVTRSGPVPISGRLHPILPRSRGVPAGSDPP
jgi:predicted RNA-binding protein with RPS1 domain